MVPSVEGEEEEEGEKRGRRRMKGHGEMGAHCGETGGEEGASKRRGENGVGRGKKKKKKRGEDEERRILG